MNTQPGMLYRDPETGSTWRCTYADSVEQFFVSHFNGGMLTCRYINGDFSSHVCERAVLAGPCEDDAATMGVLSQKGQIQVWQFDNAPKELKEAADQGGDDDWIVLIPGSEKQYILEFGVPFWIETMDSCREPVRLDLPNGDVLFVGCH